MKKYKGGKNFKDFFEYLSLEGMGDLFKKVHSEDICKLINICSENVLPNAYIEFMSYAGYGQFWRGSNYAIKDVHHLKEYAEQLLVENESQLKLQEDDFVFFMHQGYMFYFFNLNEGDNPPVYYYNECNEIDKFIKCCDNFIDFIIKPFITGIPNLY